MWQRISSLTLIRQQHYVDSEALVAGVCIVERNKRDGFKNYWHLLWIYIRSWSSYTELAMNGQLCSISIITIYS